ncbi:unnamed protein product [Phytophthora lilii]|uniref:Unnamed protein product n=1 Tax=Phytophthora lilii TaxID=2077276 RepID=A0A9W6TFX0_9STRA|nr:unnamed protein product [Phytophthora lilii]
MMAVSITINAIDRISMERPSCSRSSPCPEAVPHFVSTASSLIDLQRLSDPTPRIDKFPKMNKWAVAMLITIFISGAAAQTYTFDTDITPTPLPSSEMPVVVDVGSSDSDDEIAVPTPTPMPPSEMPDIDADSLDSDDEDEDDSSGSGLVDMALLNANVSTIESTYSNWVGSLIAGMDVACYRETHVADVCPLGYENKLGTCWAECPLEYPIECGMQCIRQNDDCTLEMLSKVSAVAQSALSLATFGAYGAFSKMANGVQIAFQYGKEVANLVKALTKYVRTIKVNDPQTTTDRLMTMLYQTDNVVYDLPITVMSCLGMKIVTNQADIASSWESFTTFMKNITLGGTLEDLNATDITSLQSALESNSTCGDDMKRLTDRVWLSIANLRNENSSITEAEIRVIMSKSNLMHHEIPSVTNNCMEQLIAESDEATAYTTRNTLRKTFGGIVDDLISSGTSDNGTYLTAEEYSYKISDKVMMFVAVWDPTNVAGVVSEFFQSICGPTEFIGEVDDGSASEALGLTTVGAAFNNTVGSWNKVGDGTVTVNFQSVDTEDVSVNIMSGGNKVDEVDVKAGTNVTWVSNTTALGGKTLYLDRWRAGFLGIPGTGGGSLLLWVPRSTQGGKLELTTMLNVS